MSKAPVVPNWQGRMQTLFQESAREGYYKSTDNPDLDKFEKRLERVKTKLTNHLERHSPVWIGRETFKLIEKNIGKLQPKLTPKWIIDTETSPSALARAAWQQVESRNAQRVTRVDNIAKTMRQKIDDDAMQMKSSNRMKL